MNTEERFQRIEVRLDAVEANIQVLPTWLENIDNNIQAIRTGLEGLIPQISQSLTSIQTELVSLGTRVETRLASLEAGQEQDHQMLNRLLREACATTCVVREDPNS